MGKVVEPRSLWAVFKLMFTLVLEHMLRCYQARYCKLEEARASCERLGRLLSLLPWWDASCHLVLGSFHIALHWKFSWKFFMSFCFTQALPWERQRESSDYCIVQLLNALLDYSFSLFLSDRVCESQLNCGMLQIWTWFDVSDTTDLEFV